MACEPVTVRVSTSTEYVEGDGDSDWPAVSADGWHFAFDSHATTLVPDDTNGTEDVFVFDLSTGETSRVSLGPEGIEGDGMSSMPSISADGRFVAFESGASNLVEDDTNGQHDVFVHDRRTRETTRVSVASDGSEARGVSTRPSISGDGDLVAFTSFTDDLVTDDTNLLADVFVHDLNSGKTTRVSVDRQGVEGNATSEEPSISADGRFVAFVSMASNLVANDTNGQRDAFVHDRTTGRTHRVSVASDGSQGDGPSYDPILSADGSIMALTSNAANLVADDTNLESDVFVHDLKTRRTTRVKVNTAGNELRDDSSHLSMSANGRFVVFVTGDSFVVADDTNESADVFLLDRKKGVTTRLSVSSAGEQADGSSYATALSADGSVVAFASDAGNLVPDDDNHARDVFVRGLR